MLLMTVSTSVITVLHSVEVVHVPHESRLSLAARYPLYGWNTLTHFWGVRYEITASLFNGFIYLVTYPLRFHHQCEHRTPPEASSCALWVPAITALYIPFHGSFIAASPNIPTVLQSQLPRTAGWYAKASLYHIL
jgi:hypothetical protein